MRINHALVPFTHFPTADFKIKRTRASINRSLSAAFGGWFSITEWLPLGSHDPHRRIPATAADDDCHIGRFLTGRITRQA